LEFSPFVKRCGRVEPWDGTFDKWWNFRIFDIQQCCAVCFLLASIDLCICDFSVGKSIHEARHALKTTPFGFTVSLFHANGLLKLFINFDFGEVALRVSLTTILHNDSVLARRAVHQHLVLITFRLLDIVCALFPFAFLDFIVVIFRGHLACMLCPQVLVEKSIRETSPPSTRFRALPLRTMNVVTTDCL
jgi:hypothetical protein